MKKYDDFAAHVVGVYRKEGNKGSALHYKNKNGTAYFLTAHSVVEGLGDEMPKDIYLSIKGGWKEYQAQLAYTDFRVAVFSVQAGVNDFDLYFELCDARYGQTCFFWGYPYAASSLEPFSNDKAMIMPAMVAGFGDESKTYYLAGMNSLGFTGGPCVYFNGEKPCVFGVTGAPQPQMMPLLNSQGDPLLLGVDQLPLLFMIVPGGLMEVFRTRTAGLVAYMKQSNEFENPLYTKNAGANALGENTKEESIGQDTSINDDVESRTILDSNDFSVISRGSSLIIKSRK